MANIGHSVQKEWIRNLWMNCNKQSGNKNESLWTRVSEMVSAFNGEIQQQKEDHRMKPDTVPVGVDCTIRTVLPTGVDGQPRNEFTTILATNTTTTASNSSTFISSTESPIRRVVCSPDLPVYPLVPAKSAEKNSNIDASTPSKASPVQGLLQKIYRCTVCSEGFSQKSSLTAHLKMHTKECDDPHQCDFCGKTFAVPARLTRHYRTHTGEKPYQCEYCNKSFSVKENLSVHKRIHTKERPYKCEVCERAFEHSGKLHRHMRIHTGERPHKCNFCSKTFIQSGQLVIHLRTHTGEKPYVCKCCNKGFTCSKQLKVHTRTHTGEKPYACDICGKSFGYNHVLKLHQVAHYGEKVYKCTICKQTFTSKKTMETHIKMSHSDSNAARTATEAESSSTSSASDKENKVDLAIETFPPRTVTPDTSFSERNTSGLPPKLEPIPIYDSYLQTNNGTTNTTIFRQSDANSNPKGYTSSASQYSHYPSNLQGTLNTALLAAATAAATEDLVTNYHRSNENNCGSSATAPPQPSKFQILAPAMAGQYYASAPSPSSCSESSLRSSPSPKLEIIEPVDDSSMFLLPECNELRYRCEASLMNTNHPSSSVIIHQVPYGDGLTPCSSSSTSPLPSSPDLIDLASVREELSLPPRKRTKMILKSMEKDKAEDTNFRYNSVIHYAKASQIA